MTTLPVVKAVCRAPRAQAVRLIDIVARLENWAMWATSSDGPRGAACMTDAICETLRRAKEGPAHSSGLAYRSIDTNDAVLIGRAMVRLTLNHRRILGLHYVDGQRRGFIAALLRFPPLEFDKRFAEAHAAIEAALNTAHMSSSSQ